MKNYKIFLMIFAFAGLMWACESTDPFVNDVMVNLVTGNFDTALQITNEALEEDPDNYVALYYRGLILATQAEELPDPFERRPLYEEARENFERAKAVMSQMEVRPSEYEETNETIVAFWADEYNLGVNIQTDSLFTGAFDDLQRSLAHFRNAATINPDSAMTFQVMSSTHYQLQDAENAINTYETAMSLLNPPQVDDYEYLTSLYLIEGRFDDAIRLSQEALDLYPAETSFVQFMADAYIQSGQRDTAIELIEGLIENDPNNPQYRRVLGTQIYQQVDQLTQDVSALYEQIFDLDRAARSLSGSAREAAEAEISEIRSQITEMESDIDDLTMISIREIERVVELEPESESANFILGIIYQNRAASLFDRRNNAPSNDLVMQYDDMARDTLRDALVFYERAAELNPDNPENWRSLFQVYTTLGMEEQAEEAMRRAGFDD